MPDIYSYDEIPLRRDTIVLSKKDFDYFEKCWDWCLRYGRTGMDEPNAWIRIRWGWIEDRFDDYLNVAFMINQSDRFHQCSHKLPKLKIVKSVHYHEFQKRPFLIVDEDWFNHSWDASYCSFALVDAIGVKKYLMANGNIDPKALDAFNRKVRFLSYKHPNYLFLTFADSTIIRAKWRRAAVTGYVETYDPERLLVLANKVRQYYKEALNLDSYVVATQGLLEDSFNGHYKKSFFGNHFAVGSLGTPVANLYEIEKAVRYKIRKKEMEPHELYLSEDFYLSLRFGFNKRKDLSEKKMTFSSDLNPGSFNSFIPTSLAEINSMLDLNKKKSNFKWEIKKRFIRLEIYVGKLGLAYKVGRLNFVFKTILSDLRS